MLFSSPKRSLLVLGVTALTISRTWFAFIDDSEGPNLIVVAVLAAILYVLALPVFLFYSSSSDVKRFLLATIAQMLLAVGFYLLFA